MGKEWCAKDQWEEAQCKAQPGVGTHTGGQAAPASPAGHESWVTGGGHTGSLSLLCEPVGTLGELWAGEGAGSNLRAGFYEDESQRNAEWVWPGQLRKAAAVANAGGHGGSHQVGANEAERGGFWDCLGGHRVAWASWGGQGVCSLAHVPGTPGKSQQGQSDWGSPGPQMELSEGPLDTTTQQGTRLRQGVTPWEANWDGRRLRVERDRPRGRG